MTCFHQKNLIALLTLSSIAGVLGITDHTPALGQGRGKQVSRKSADSFVSLSIAPLRISLKGAYDEVHPLADGKTRSGEIRDATGETTFSVSDKTVAYVDNSGVVRGLKDGKTTLIAVSRGRYAKIQIEVSGFSKPTAPRFITDAQPILTKTGCNMGSCHGAGAGKGGFKLSLQGYDPDLDYEAITRASGSRRVSLAQPENSLFLRKPAFVVFHKGGQRFAVNSPEFRLLKDWIAAGMPAPSLTEPRVVSLEVPNPIRTMSIGQTQNYTLWAKFSDGSKRDVTGQTLFTASDETVASVTPNGLAKVTGSGEGAILMRYQGLVTNARIVSPYGNAFAQASKSGGRVSKFTALKRKRDLAKYSPSNPVSARIDRIEDAKLAQLGLSPSPLCTDSDFLRRASLDVIGLLPTPDETRAFLSSKDPLKREKLTESLLNRPEYTDYWTQQWGDLLRSSRRTLGDKGMNSLNDWIRQGVESDKPWNLFAKELILAQGSAYRDGNVNYYRSATTPQTLAETTSQVFLGVRIQCAKCHNHPYEKWTQNQYFQMAAFFSRVTSKTGERKDEPIVFLASTGEVNHPKTGKVVAPCALDSTPLPATFAGDRREPLADWMTSPKNPFFAKALVNRLWKHFLGRGLVEPTDDLRVTNPPSNPELFDALAEEFVRHGYDLKSLMRSILLTRVYQRSPETSLANDRDTKFYSHYAFKRLEAEPLLDALCSATGVTDKFDGLPLGTRAVQLPDPAVASYFLDLFGRPARTIACACERSDDPNLGQTLHLMNNAGVNGRLSAKTGRIMKLIESKAPDAKIIEEFYLAAYSRFPNPTELKQGVASLSTSKNRQQKMEDLLWALLNSKEFLFNH